MKKVLLTAAVAALISGTGVTGSAFAQSRADRAALTANQIVAESDAHTARVKADLRLTPDQEKNWPGFESAVHDIDKTRADRQVAFQAEREQREDGSDVIQYLNDSAKFLGEHSANVKKLADAAQPLYASLDEQQKKKFANELIGLSREREIDE
ncbi:Spy/CpxP family protein refolding chaperone [Methyloferula stellata]|uniref:Spy/CpxP family protein refolding chaperone n=1 Tax=Methyloferula stellata TaxID=876270 RepID=UPI0003745691|nr:Spy/CpxP family protein refolding chaperone [Methyloferula stellata]